MELTFKDVDERIHDKTEGPLARIEAAVDVIALKVTYMETHMKEANGRTSKNEERIEEVKEAIITLQKNLPHSITNCPQNEILLDLKEFSDKLKNKKEVRQEIGEAYIKSKAEKRAEFLKIVTTIGVVVAALALSVNLIFSILGYSQRQDLKKEVDKIEKIENVK